MSIEEQTEFEYLSIINLLRKYIKRIQPQCFASAFGIFLKLKNRCECYGIDVKEDVSDIYAYAKAEQIEKYGFEY